MIKKKKKVKAELEVEDDGEGGGGWKKCILRFVIQSAESRASMGFT